MKIATVLTTSFEAYILNHVLFEAPNTIGMFIMISHDLNINFLLHVYTGFLQLSIYYCYYIVFMLRIVSKES